MSYRTPVFGLDHLWPGTLCGYCLAQDQRYMCISFSSRFLIRPRNIFDTLDTDYDLIVHFNRIEEIVDVLFVERCELIYLI